MGHWCLLACLLLVPSISLGASKNIGRPHQTAAYTTYGTDIQDIFVCLLPDTQSQARVVPGWPYIGSPNDCRAATDCTGASCTKSPYCKGNWNATGYQQYMNEAYDLTGQWDRIDWTGITGPNDRIQQRPFMPLDHPRCDLILSLGDMMGADDGMVALLPACTLTAQGEQYNSYLATRDFWTIIKASGIPFNTLIGNHDTKSCYTQLVWTDLGFASLPWFYSKTADNLSQTIKTTIKGKTFCAVGYKDALAAANYGEATDIAYVRANIGCGGNFATFQVSHGGDIGGTFDHAGSGEVFYVPWGHYTVVIGSGTNEVQTNGGGEWAMWDFTNFQNATRHFAFIETDGAGLGSTPRDGYGGAYEIVHISPGRNLICSHEWSPYWQSSNLIDNGQEDLGGLGYTMERRCDTVDFNARFPTP